MVRPGVKQRFKITEVADIIGCTTRTLRKPALRESLGVEVNPTTGVRFLSRDRLLEYLIEHEFPAETYRHILQPDGGRVFCLGVPGEVRELLRGTRPIPVPGPVRLGMALAQRPTRAVLLGVDWMPPGEAGALAAELTANPDRPFVVGLYADATPDTPAPFDGVISVLAGRRLDSLLAASPITLKRVRR